MKRLTISIISILFLLPLIHCQENIIFFGSDMGIAASTEQAKFKKEVETKRGKIKIQTFIREGNDWILFRKEAIRPSGNKLYKISSTDAKPFRKRYLRYYSDSPSGDYYFKEYIKGELAREGVTSRKVPLILRDTVKSYYPGGRLKSVAIYEKNKLLNNQNWLKDGTEYIPDLHYYVDKIPELSSGQVFFRHYILNGLKEAGIDLTQVNDLVILGWVVMEDGSVEGIHTIKGSYRMLNETLIKLIRELPGDWIPASLHGNSVNYFMELPFNFTQDYEGFDNLEFSGELMIWY